MRLSGGRCSAAFTTMILNAGSYVMRFFFSFSGLLFGRVAAPRMMKLGQLRPSIGRMGISGGEETPRPRLHASDEDNELIYNERIQSAAVIAVPDSGSTLDHQPVLLQPCCLTVFSWRSWTGRVGEKWVVNIDRGDLLTPGELLTTYFGVSSCRPPLLISSGVSCSNLDEMLQGCHMYVYVFDSRVRLFYTEQGRRRARTSTRRGAHMRHGLAQTRDGTLLAPWLAHARQDASGDRDAGREPARFGHFGHATATDLPTGSAVAKAPLVWSFRRLVRWRCVPS